MAVANQSDPRRAETVEFLIDSGAAYSVVPQAILERLAPVPEQTFRLASGQTIKRQTAGALFKFGNKAGVAAVIFGEESDSTLLGAQTLESLALALDPIRRELLPLPMMLAFLPSVAEE
jgi:predicted aspartyl protease